MTRYHIGDLLLNRFRIDDFIASGGMSTVYRVWDLERSAPLAMKVLNPELAADPAFLIRFQNEARSLQQLAHPNIVPFYGLYQSPQTTFLLERYIDGPSLGEVLRQRRGTPLPEEEVLTYLKALNAGLSYAHGKGVIHCDVKPGNVLIDQGGHIYLTDFGIARFTEGPTATMAAMGTPAYMAPEQIRGEALSRRTDVYSLGVLLYEMLTGHRPFRASQDIAPGASTVEQAESVRAAHLHQPPPDPRLHHPFLSEAISGVILKALAKDPAARYDSVAELSTAVFAAAELDPARIPSRVRLWDEMHPPTLPANAAANASFPHPYEYERVSTTRSPRQRTRLPRAVLAALLLTLLGVSAVLAMRLPQRNANAGNPPAATETANVSLPGFGTQEQPVETPLPGLTATLTAATAPPVAQLPGDFSLTGQMAVVLRQDGADMLQLYDLDSGSLTPLPEADSKARKNWAPQWSPDGSRLTWFADSGNQDRLFVLDLASDNINEIPTAQREFKGIHSPAFLPGGEVVSFYGLEGQDYWLATASIVSHDLLDSIRLPRYRNLFVWNWVTSQLAFVQQTNDQYDVVISGSADATGLVIDTGSEDYAPAWSNDGAWLAFQSDADRGRGENEIWIVRTDGSGLRQVTSSPPGVWCRAPTWSPDGSQIAYVSNQAGSSRSDYGEIFVVEVATGTVRQVTSTGGDIYDWRPAWRP